MALMPRAALAPFDGHASLAIGGGYHRDRPVARHENIETTHVYLEADLATKEQALHKLAPVDTPLSRFRAEDPFLAFLTSPYC